MTNWCEVLHRCGFKMYSKIHLTGYKINKLIESETAKVSARSNFRYHSSDNRNPRLSELAVRWNRTATQRTSTDPSPAMLNDSLDTTVPMIDIYEQVTARGLK